MPENSESQRLPPVDPQVQGRVAVITRTKDRVHFLDRNIQSVLAQTYANFVHVIVNDGGDPTPVDELVDKYTAKYAGRCQVVHNSKSLLRGGAADAGINASESEFIVLLDDDDTWDPEFLAVMVRTLQDEKCPPSFRGAVCYSYQVWETFESGELKIQGRRASSERFSEPLLYTICQGNYILTCSFLYRRDVLEKTGLYEGQFPICEDWDFNIRFLRHYDVAVVEQRLSHRHFRENPDFDSSSAGTHHVQQMYQAQLRNHYLRDDLDNNRVGIGFLLNVGHEAQLSYDYALRLQRLEAALRQRIPFYSQIRNFLKKDR